MNKDSPITYYIEALIKLMRISPNWMSSTISRFITKRNMKIHLYGGVDFSFNPRNSADLTMMVEVFGMQLYNPPFLEINKTDVVFDIGAHVWYFSLYASQKASDGKVYSFEPMKSNYQALSEHISMNNSTNATAENIAVWWDNGEVDFYLFEGHNGCHSLYKRQDKQDTIRVKKKNIKTIMEENHIERIDFMKLDCEGAEFEIFENMESETLAKIGKISMELHPRIIPGKTADTILTRFHSEGFIAVEADGFIYAINKKIITDS